MVEQFSTELASYLPRVEGVVSFRFRKPRGFSFQAGQFFILTLFPGEAREMTKHFSFSNSPTENYIEFTTRMTGSEFKNTLAELEVGDKVRLKGPYGHFVLDDEAERIAFLVGGIGITAARSICKYCTDKKSDKNIIVLYGNRKADQITFKEDFERMAKENLKLKLVYVISRPDKDWVGYTGHIDEDLIKKEVENYKERVFYISGPPRMVTATAEILMGLNISLNRIHQESFTGY